MQLSERLSAVALLVSEGSRLADVGTDHGYVPIYLVRKGRIPSAVAMDVNMGPLNRAREHIREYDLEGCIETRLSDGLDALSPGDADSVIIAGMGGFLTMRIMARAKNQWADIQEWILQPQSEVGRVRHFLADEGFCITDEDMVEEDGKFYPIMRVIRGVSRYETEADFLFGKGLLEQKHPVLFRWLIRENQKISRVIAGLGSQTSDTAGIRQEELKNYRKEIQEALARYEM